MDLDKMRNNVEVSDDHILLGKPLELLKYGKKLEIKQVNWFYDWEMFSYHLAVFLMYYNQAIEVSTLPKSIDELKEMQDNIKSIIAKNGLVDKLSGGKAFRSLCELCKYTGASVRWMKKKFTIDDWIEVFMYVYLYNVVGKKKRLENRIRSGWNSPIKLDPAKGEIFLHLKKTFSLKELKELTALQVYLLIQRENEPEYKRRLDDQLLKDRTKNG